MNICVPHQFLIKQQDFLSLIQGPLAIVFLFFGLLGLYSIRNGCTSRSAWELSLSWCLLLLSWVVCAMSGIPRSSWSVLLDTYYGASVIVRSVLLARLRIRVHTFILTLLSFCEQEYYFPMIDFILTPLTFFNLLHGLSNWISCWNNTSDYFQVLININTNIKFQSNTLHYFDQKFLVPCTMIVRFEAIDLSRFFFIILTFRKDSICFP